MFYNYIPPLPPSLPSSSPYLALEIPDVTPKGGQVGVGRMEDEGEGSGGVGHASLRVAA